MGDEDQEQRDIEPISSSSSRKPGKGSRDFVYTTLSSSNWSPLPVLWPPALTVLQIQGGSWNAPEQSQSLNINNSNDHPNDPSPGMCGGPTTS
jgi:hypothetical protein